MARLEPDERIPESVREIYEHLAGAVIETYGVVDGLFALYVHTNCLENFCSLLKRALRGTYVNVEPFHLFRYCDEQAFRFNERKDNDKGRFMKVTSRLTGKRLTYVKLIDLEIKDGDRLPPETTGTSQTA